MEQFPWYDNKLWKYKVNVTDQLFHFVTISIAFIP